MGRERERARQREARERTGVELGLGYADTQCERVTAAVVVEVLVRDLFRQEMRGWLRSCPSTYTYEHVKQRQAMSRAGREYCAVERGVGGAGGTGEEVWACQQVCLVLWLPNFTRELCADGEERNHVAIEAVDIEVEARWCLEELEAEPDRAGEACPVNEDSDLEFLIGRCLPPPLEPVQSTVHFHHKLGGVCPVGDDADVPAALRGEAHGIGMLHHGRWIVTERAGAAARAAVVKSMVRSVMGTGGGADIRP